MVTAGLRPVLAVAILASGCTAGAATSLPDALPPGDYAASKAPEIELPQAKASMRDEALRRARVWRQPRVPISHAALDASPPPPWGKADEFVCRFLPTETHGTTGKFDCVLPGGNTVKVKYARSGEIPSEVGASRLLVALGFGADDMYILRRVRCFGCPWSPFLTMKALEWVALRDRYVKRIDYTTYVDFDWVAVERRFHAPELRVDGGPKGWAWYELDRVSAQSGGSPRAEIDALRLIAVFLNHWDNKADNQRLVCSGGWNDERGCVEPFAFIHDLGANFGPHKPNYRKWTRTPVWTDPATCRVSMKRLPYGGATFEDVTITEEGRRFMAQRLAALSDPQLHALFDAARFPEHDAAVDREADIGRWVSAFKDKVHQIADRPPCPAS